MKRWERDRLKCRYEGGVIFFLSQENPALWNTQKEIRLDIWYFPRPDRTKSKSEGILALVIREFSFSSFPFLQKFIRVEKKEEYMLYLPPCFILHTGYDLFIYPAFRIQFKTSHEEIIKTT